MAPDIEETMRHARQLEAARVLVHLLQLGMLTPLPAATWTCTRSGNCLLLQATDPDGDDRETTLRAWAAALEAEVTAEGDTLTAAARRGPRGSVEILLTADLSTG